MNILFKEYCATLPTTPGISTVANSLGNGNNIVGQKLTYTCNTGYEFKDVVPAGASSQGLFPTKFQILNVLLKV